MEEKIIPPDENGWEEVKDFERKEVFGKLLLSRFRGYFKDEKSGEGLVTAEYLDAGVVIKSHAHGPSDNRLTNVYLQLSDGRWVKGKNGKAAEAEMTVETRDGKKFLRLILILETENGCRRRIIRKQLE